MCREAMTRQARGCPPQRGLLAGLAAGWGLGTGIPGGPPTNSLTDKQGSLCLDGLNKQRDLCRPPAFLRGSLGVGKAPGRASRWEWPPGNTQGAESLMGFPGR